VVSVINTAKYGKVLTTAKGFALYTYTADLPGGPGCSGECLVIWPPLLLPAGVSTPVGAPGVTGLGTFKRAQGTQVTFHGLPLYTYIDDKAPGQITGQNVVDPGGKWILAILAAAAAPATTHPPAPTTPMTAPPTTPPPTLPPPTAPPATAPPVTHPPATAPPTTHPPAPPSTSPPTTAPAPPVY
jgi:predicted lipoprotein with Yx(FWY)xxD motif